MAVVWDDAKISKLIEMFEAKRVLWDYLNKSYKDKSKKNDAWEEISEALDIPRRDVENKMHILRSQFAREKKKVSSSRTKETDSEISKWKFYEPLKFLLNVSGVSGSDASNKTAHQEEFQETEQPMESVTTSTPSTSRSSTSHPRHQPAPIPQDTAKRKLNDLTEILQMVKTAKRKMSESKDEFDFYGQYVASELRMMKNEKAVLKAKSFINNILIDMRMGKYDGSQNYQSHPGYENVLTSASSPSCEFENVKIEVSQCESVSDSDDDT